jgi:hypothetical protein
MLTLLTIIYLICFAAYLMGTISTFFIYVLLNSLQTPYRFDWRHLAYSCIWFAVWINTAAYYLKNY